MDLKKLINDYGTAKHALGMHHERNHETCSLPPLHVVEDSVKKLGEELKHFLHCIDTSRIPKPPIQTEPLEKVFHTTEEWEVDWQPGNEWADVTADGWPILLPRQEVPGVHRERTLAEALANARLAAAAPKLLDLVRTYWQSRSEAKWQSEEPEIHSAVMAEIEGKE